MGFDIMKSWEIKDYNFNIYHKLLLEVHDLRLVTTNHLYTEVEKKRTADSNAVELYWCNFRETGTVRF